MGRDRRRNGGRNGGEEQPPRLSRRDSVLLGPPGKEYAPPWERPPQTTPGAHEDYRHPSRAPYKALKQGEAPGPHKNFEGAREIPVDVWARVQVFERAALIGDDATEGDAEGGAPQGGPPRLAYKEFDVSDDIIGSSYTRNMNAPSRLSLTLANDGDKYRNLFIPKCRVRVWTRRGESVMVAFTGYVRRNPYFSLVSQREITLECDDLIGRFVDKEWDPNLPENINAVSSYLPASQQRRFPGNEGGGRTGEDPNAEGGPPETPGAIDTGEPEGGEPPGVVETSSDAEAVLAGRRLVFSDAEGDEGDEGADEEGGESEENPEEELAGPEDTGNLQQAVWPDETLAYLLTADEHIGLEPHMVWIQRFPESWKRRAAEIDAQIGYCFTPYDDLIICPEGGLSNPCETESSDEPGSGPDSESARDIARYIAAEAVKKDMPPELPVITALVESEMRPDLTMAQSDRDSAGLYQQRSHYGSEADRMDVAKSTAWFLRDAEEFRGNCGPDDADCIGLWAANVQRPQEDLRYKYATRFQEARGLIGDSAESYGANYSPNRHAELAFDDAEGDEDPDAPPGGDPPSGGEGSEPPAAERPDGSFDPEEAPCGSGSAGGGGGASTEGSLNVASGEICCDYMAGCSIAQNPHAGVDVCAPTGSEIKAWGDGEVIHSQIASGYATTTIVDFGGEYVLFGHLLSGSTKPTGTTFRGGDVIGKVGTSADAMGTAPHAHIQCFTSRQAAIGYNNSAVKDPKEVHRRVTGSSAAAVFVADTSQAGPAPGSPSTREPMMMLSEEVAALGKEDPHDHATADGEGVVCAHCGNPEPDSLLFGIPGIDDFGGEAGADESGGTGRPPIGYSHVNRNRELVYSLDTRYATFFESAAQKWSALGGVRLRKGSGSEVTCRVSDTSLGAGTIGRTYSDGRLYFNPSEMDRATDNAKLCCALHEIGHALGYPHATPRSVMNTPILSNRNSNPDAPTDYDKKLHAETWGAEGGGGGQEENLVLKEFLTKCLECVGGPYRWGGGHGETFSSTADIKRRGADCSGVLSGVRGLMNLQPSDIGPTGAYEDFIVNKSEFDPSKSYPPGTVLNNPGTSGGGVGIGHIAIVSDEEGRIFEANGGAGRIMNSNTIQSGNEGWEGFTTAGEMPDVGTAASVGTGGSGEGPHTDDGDSEPCIMKNPLGPYKLAFTAEYMNQSSWLRSAALNNGNFDATVDAQRGKEETGMDYNPHLFDNTPEDRDWTELGRMHYEPYLPTVQGIAGSGMYQFMTVGTGEVVFWYPHYLIERAAYFLLPDGFADRDEAERREYWGRMDRDERAKLYGALSEDRFSEVFPWVSEGTKAILEEHLAENPHLASTPYEGMMSDDESPDAEVEGDVRNVEFLETPMVVQDIELKDFHLEISDEELVTHYYVMGDFRFEGASYLPMALETMCSRWATVKYHPLFDDLVTEGQFDWQAFLDLYGSRTLTESVPALKTPGLAQLYADNEFMRRWLQNYTITIDVAYMPELYPGMKLEIESLGIQVSILQVSGTMGDSWTTTVACSMPLQITDERRIPPIPFWTIPPKEATQVGQGDEPTINAPGGAGPEAPLPEGETGTGAPGDETSGVERRELERITDELLREFDERQREREDYVDGWIRGRETPSGGG